MSDVLTHETGKVATFLRGILIADAAIISLGLQAKVWRNLAPPGSDCPYIILRLQSARDKNALGARNRLFSRVLYQIMAVTEGTDDTVGDAIAVAVDKAVVGRNDLVGADGVWKLGVFREEPLEYAEDADGTRYNYIGGLYRVFVHTP